MALLEIPSYVEHLPIPEFMIRNRTWPLDPEWCSVFLATQNQVSDSDELLSIIDKGGSPPAWATHVAIFSKSHP